MQKDAINNNRAKNILLFIGDGMSNPTISAARILKGIQEKSSYPERGYFSFERFPHLGRIKVYKFTFRSVRRIKCPNNFLLIIIVIKFFILFTWPRLLMLTNKLLIALLRQLQYIPGSKHFLIH